MRYKEVRRFVCVRFKSLEKLLPKPKSPTLFPNARSSVPSSVELVYIAIGQLFRERERENVENIWANISTWMCLYKCIYCICIELKPVVQIHLIYHRFLFDAFDFVIPYK